MLLAIAAVGSVRDEVTNRPSPLQSSGETAALLSGTTSTLLAPPTSGAPVVPATTAVPVTTAATTTSVGASTTRAPSPPATTAVTTSQAPTTTQTPPTTTSAPEGEYFKSYQLVGGWVRLRVLGDQVYLDGSVPSPGYSVDVKSNGPGSVEVEFEDGSRESKLHAEVKGGELDVEIEEEGDD